MTKHADAKFWNLPIVNGGRRSIDAEGFTANIAGSTSSALVTAAVLRAFANMRAGVAIITIGMSATLTSSSDVLAATISAPRTSGPAPLAVTYSAKDSTITGLSADQVWRNLYCQFEVVGETGVSNYATTGLDRYLQTGGPICSFNILDPGSYTVRVTGTVGTPWATGHYYAVGDFVTQDGNTYECETAHTSGTFSTDFSASPSRWSLYFIGHITDTDDVAVTAQDPDAVWPGTDTICISTSGNFTGAPSGCTQITGSSPGTVASNKRYLYFHSESFSGVEIPWGVTGTMIGRYGGSSKPTINGIHAENGGGDNIWQEEIIIASVTSPSITANLCPYRWTVYNCDVPTDGVNDSGIDFGAAIGGFYPGSTTEQKALYKWPAENHIFESHVWENTDVANLGISGYFNFGGMVACIVEIAHEHSARIWQASNSFFGHNALYGVSADASGIRHAIKMMSSGNWVTWTEYIDTSGIAWPGGYSDVGGMGSFNLTIANNLMGSADFNNAWITAFGPQNSDAETVEVFQDIIYENNIAIRPASLPGGFADLNACGKRCVTRFNTVQGGGSPLISTTTSEEYNQGAGTGRQVMRDFWCGPYYGQDV